MRIYKTHCRRHCQLCAYCKVCRCSTAWQCSLSSLALYVSVHKLHGFREHLLRHVNLGNYCVILPIIKFLITPKSFFRLNKSLHLFETHCAFLPLLNPNIDLLQTVKVMKSVHHPSHDRASKGYGSILCLTSQTSLHACFQTLNTMQISLWHQTRNGPMPLTSSVVWQMMAGSRDFYNVKKSQDLV